MNDIESATVPELKKDFELRGYSESEIAELLEMAVLIIPGTVTSTSSEEPIQKLTTHVVMVSKDLSAKEIENRVVLLKGKRKKYVEERDAHIDLGAIVISLQQLGGLANLAQILDFLLTLIQVRFIRRRTQELTPETKFALYIRNKNGVVKWRIKGTGKRTYQDDHSGTHQSNYTSSAGLGEHGREEN